MKEQYIKQVSRALTVSRKQKKDILRDLEEAFESAKEHGESEEQVIERLGEPEEFAAEMSEMNAEAQKGIPKKKVAVIVCVLVVIAVIGAFSATYLPELFKFGNPIPYIKAAMQLNGDTHVVRIFREPDEKTKENRWESLDYLDYCIMSDEYPSGYVYDYILQNFGLQFTAANYESEHGLATFIHTFSERPEGGYIAEDYEMVEVETFFGKYYVWNIDNEPNFYYYSQHDNHELLDNLCSIKEGDLAQMNRGQINSLLGEPKEVTEDSDLYRDCFMREVVIKYNDDGTVAQIIRDGKIKYSGR